MSQQHSELIVDGDAPPAYGEDTRSNAESHDDAALLVRYQIPDRPLPCEMFMTHADLSPAEDHGLQARKLEAIPCYLVLNVQLMQGLGPPPDLFIVREFRNHIW